MPRSGFCWLDPLPAPWQTWRTLPRRRAIPAASASGGTGGGCARSRRRRERAAEGECVCVPGGRGSVLYSLFPTTSCLPVNRAGQVLFIPGARLVFPVTSYIVFMLWTPINPFTAGLFFTHTHTPFHFLYYFHYYYSSFM